MSQRKRLSHHASGRVPLSQQKQKRAWHRSNGLADSSFYNLPSVMDNMSVDLVHTVGFFDSTKRCVRQVYSVLITALGRRDPLPRMVRDAIESLMRTPPAPPSPPPQVDQRQRSELETITALDIPYTLRHFDFDLSVVARNSDASAAVPGVTVSAVTAATSSGCAVASFSLSELKSRRTRGSIELLRVCRQVANLLVAMEFSSTVRRALEDTRELRPSEYPGGSACAKDRGVTRTARGNGSFSGRVSCRTSQNGCYRSRRSNNAAGTYSAPNNAFNTSPEDSSSSSSPMSSTSPPPSLLTPTASVAAADYIEFGGGGPSMSLSACPQVLTTGIDGSNSNRVTSQMSQYQVQHQSRATAADFSTDERMCPQHLDRSHDEDGEYSCAVCASQHFMHRHMQRLALEKGGLARLEDALCDCLQLQEQWRHSVNWVTGNVRDNRLSEPIRPLIRCMCVSEAARDASGRGVTVNPQIIISTDGHCSAVQCVNRCSGSSSFGLSGSGRGGGASKNCCWDAPAATFATKDAP